MTPTVEWSSLIILLCSLFPYCMSTYMITVDAQDEDCYYERVSKGSKIALRFEVYEGGFLDIDIKVTDPDGDEMLTRERENNGKYIFVVSKTGEYTYCFVNKMSTMTPKGIMFSIDTNEPRPSISKTTTATLLGDDGEENNTTKVTAMLKELSNTLVQVKIEQAFTELRDKMHIKINESTNFYVVVWSFFEAILVVTMTGYQVYYLKRFFEVRRVV